MFFKELKNRLLIPQVYKAFCLMLNIQKILFYKETSLGRHIFSLVL